VENFIYNNSSSIFSHIQNVNSTRIFKITTFFILGGMGISGNIFIIVIAVKYTVRRNLHHLIINMAVSDTLIISMLFTTKCLNWSFNGGAWRYLKKHSGDVFCKIPRFVIAVGMWSVFITLVIISIERFRATKAVQRICSYPIKTCFTVIAFIWISSLALACNELNISYISKTNDNNYTCTNKPTSIFVIIILGLSAISGMLVLLVLNLYTLKQLSKHESIEDNIPERQRRDRAKRTANAIKMVLCSFLVFCCCYGFVQIGNVNKFLGVGIRKALGVYLHWLQFAISVSPLINSTLSPYIYLNFLKDFREAFRNIFARIVASLRRRRVGVASHDTTGRAFSRSA